jgi:carbonic anhydrase
MTGKSLTLGLTAAAIAFVLASCGGGGQQSGTGGLAETSEPPHWDYGAEHGPAHWGGLSPDYVACAEGSSQSPIDIASAGAQAATTTLAAEYGSIGLDIDHHEHVTEVIDNGHTIQVNCSGGGSLTAGDETYGLAQFHFHSPSEHTVDGKSFPMEMHMVHKSPSGKLAVVGTLIEEGAANAAFESIWANLPTQKGQEIDLPNLMIDVDKLLPADRAAYRYDGSLTTPPCSEGVRWFVLKTPIAMSAGQIDAFRAIISGNNRPTQPLNARPITVEALAKATAAR